MEDLQELSWLVVASGAGGVSAWCWYELRQVAI